MSLFFLNNYLYVCALWSNYIMYVLYENIMTLFYETIMFMSMFYETIMFMPVFYETIIN